MRLSRTLLFVTMVATVIGALPNEQINSLLEFFNATGGAFWSNSVGQWNDTSEPCSTWFGVVCRNNSVYALYLASNNLSGTLVDLKLSSLVSL
jgi:hypothetical protein